MSEPNDRRFPPEKIAKLDSPQRHAMQPPAAIVEILAAARPATVLDVGVGTGFFALPLAAALPESKVIGLDVEPRMLAVFEERATEKGLAGQVELLEAPPDAVPLPDGAVDAALLANVYHELDDRGAYLRELHRTIAPAC